MTSSIIVAAPFTLADTSSIDEQAARFLAESVGTIAPSQTAPVADNDSDDDETAAA